MRQVFLIKWLTNKNLINFDYRTNLSEMKANVWEGRNESGQFFPIGSPGRFREYPVNNCNFSYFSIFNRNPDNSIIKELTVVAWVKIAQQSTDAVIFVSGKGGINGFLFQRLNDVLYGVAKTRSRYVRINQNTGFQGLSGKWAHVAMTYKGNPLLILMVLKQAHVCNYVYHSLSKTAV